MDHQHRHLCAVDPNRPGRHCEQMQNRGGEGMGELDEFDLWEMLRQMPPEDFEAIRRDIMSRAQRGSPRDELLPRDPPPPSRDNTAEG